MNKLFTIGEIAQLLDLPTPTLRFWEEKGLFFIPKAENRYRQYTLEDVIHIADVVSLRSLGIPIRDVTAIQTYSVPQYREYLTVMQRELEQKILSYQTVLNRLCAQKQHLAEVERLSRHEFAFEPIPFSAISAFYYNEKAKLGQYIEDPSLYVRYFDTQDLSTETRAIIEPPHSAEKLLWQKCGEDRYLTFLIQEKVDENYLSNLPQKLAQVQKKYRTGVLLAQYLFTASENGARVDYLKAYLEATPLSGEPVPEDA